MTEMSNTTGKPEDSDDIGRQDDNERKQGNAAHPDAGRQGKPQRSRKRQNVPTPNYEVSPRLWTDTYWEPPEEPLESALTLPLEGYQTWLASRRMERTVGVQPSAYENPLSVYIEATLGIQPRLQTDGRRTWFMLQLTKSMRDGEARYLRVMLPSWTTPLALEYTAFEVGRTSGRPMQRSVSALEAFDVVRRAKKSQEI